MITRIKRLLRLARAVWWLTRPYSYLVTTGFLESHAAGWPCNREGEPIPWLPYSLVRFLEERVRPEFRVFEFGTGGSTLWWAKRVALVCAVESQRHWYTHVRGRMPSNVRLLLEEDAERYPEQVTTQGTRFDVVVIDGGPRERCARPAVEALDARGVIVWDDACRPVYQDAQAWLMSQGFRRLDFVGLKPRGRHSDQTAIFYRPDNVLGL